MDDSYRVAPSGPALKDRVTQVALRRYRSGAWLLVGAGVVVLGAAAAGAVQSLSEPAPFSLEKRGDFLTVVSLGLGLVLLNAGLISSVRARRWRRVLDEHAWRAVQYYYCENVTRGGVRVVGGDASLGQLIVRDPADKARPRSVCLNLVWTPWVRWRMRPWRQAPRGMAWIAGDLTGAALVVALPGPGRLFAARWGRWTPVNFPS